MSKVADAFRRPSVLIETPAYHSTSPHQYPSPNPPPPPLAPSPHLTFVIHSSTHPIPLARSRL